MAKKDEELLSSLPKSLRMHCRCIAGTSLQQALSQALLCPLLDPKAPQDVGVPSWGIPEKGKGWRPVWRGDEEDSLGQLYSLRVLNGSSYIVKRPDPFYKVERWVFFRS